MTKEAAAIAARLGRPPHPDDWAPHAGPQSRYLRLVCFEALYGGAAGGGKSDALLIDATRGIDRGHGAAYSAILFRRTYDDLERSLIRRSYDLYPRLGGKFNASKFVWRFPRGETIAFRHLQHELDVLAHKSAQYQFVGFDELTSFEEFPYVYMFSRLRSAHGVPCRMRAATNPGDVGHQWVRKRFLPWVSRRTPRPALPGEIRYFVRRGETDTEVPRGTSGALARTFVPAKLADNPTLEQGDPEYRARLAQLPGLEQARLVGGDWDAEPALKEYFDRAKVRRIKQRPRADQVLARCRGWDFGASPSPKSDASAGVLVAWVRGFGPVVEHVVHFRGAPDEVHAQFAATLAADHAADPRTITTIPLDPGAAGLMAAAEFQRRYPQFELRPVRPSGDKRTRFGGFSSRALAGTAAVVEDGTWDHEGYYAEAEGFPLAGHDDRVDATSDGYAAVAARATHGEAPTPPVPPAPAGHFAGYGGRGFGG